MEIWLLLEMFWEKILDILGDALTHSHWMLSCSAVLIAFARWELEEYYLTGSYLLRLI